ncbi:MAG: MBL fold metallo-hydrolase [Lachnospiraceae bacterium]|nr:MBL fold metallo-hydrolase [Lachnospiraceae bacterium]
MRRFFVILLILLMCLVTGCEEKPTKQPDSNNTFAAEGLQIHVISLGKADAILILADGEAMLIDAGYTMQGTIIADYLKKQGVAKLKYVVATHADKDHIGGMAHIIKNFPTEQVYLSPKKENSPEYIALAQALNDTKTKYAFSELLSTFTLGKGTFTVLAPGAKAMESGTDNDSSVVLRYVYGQRTALFMGDALSRTEKEMRENGYEYSAEILKVGHHGEGDATNKKFIREVAPMYAVITCSKEEPADEDVLSVLKAFSVEIMRTDERGTVVFSTDGAKWEVKTEK